MNTTNRLWQVVAAAGLALLAVLLTTFYVTNYKRHVQHSEAQVSVVLAAIGVYGLMGYAVQERTQEIGIRMALGANPEEVRKMVVCQGMRLAVIGVAIGVVAALALTRFMARLIYQVETWDPTVFTAVAVLLSALDWLAAYIPARRASRVEPVIALRYE